MHMFGICDGHGTNGRDAASFVKYAMHLQVEQKFPKEGKETYESIRRSLQDSFSVVQSQFKPNVQNSDFSGSTCCIVLVQGHKLITANVGDSRAILVDKLRRVRVLTEDQKPNVPAERLRIEKMGGRVIQSRDKNRSMTDEYRVFLSVNDISEGLTVSRSIGDLKAKKIGVICEPEIKHFNVEEDDQILILASDGIWKHMTI